MSVGIESIGWLSSVILLATLLRQVYTEWKSASTKGVSRWLFLGQVTASIGYTVYSVLLTNWVFTCSNIAILATAVLGQALYFHNRRKEVKPRSTG